MDLKRFTACEGLNNDFGDKLSFRNDLEDNFAFANGIELEARVRMSNLRRQCEDNMGGFFGILIKNRMMIPLEKKKQRMKYLNRAYRKFNPRQRTLPS